MIKFGQKEVTTKDFHGQNEITDLFTIDINKALVSHKVPCNIGKDCRYILGYQIDGGMVPLFIKTLKIYLVMTYHNTIKALPIQCHSMSLRKKSGCLQLKRSRMRLSHSYLKKWQQNI